MDFFSYRTGKLPLGKKTYLMGIVNITPDSFSDGGKYFLFEDAVDHALTLIGDGADLIDLGACSTKPFSEPVAPEEEQERLLPVLRALKKKTDVPVSVDTFYPSTVKAALENGADIINDIGGVFCKETASLVKEYKAGYICMHGGIKLAPAQTQAKYPDGLINSIQAFFNQMTDLLVKSGIEKEKICLDPGFGFMKNTGQNAELLKKLSCFQKRNNALLVGLSRKRFVGELSEDVDPSDRLAGTLAANILAASAGADIIRTHEIKLHKQAIKLIDCIEKKTDNS